MPEHDRPHSFSDRTSAVTITCLDHAVQRPDSDSLFTPWRLDVGGKEIGRYAFLEEAQAIGEEVYGVTVWMHDSARDTYIGAPESATRRPPVG